LVSETYVNNLVSDDLTLNQFDWAIDEGYMDLAYDTLARLIENVASDANMISRGRPARAKLNLPMPPWFDSTCRAMKAHLRRLTKLRQLGLNPHALKKRNTIPFAGGNAAQRKKKKKKTMQAAKSSSHQLRKRGHLGRKAPPPEKKRGG